MNIIITKRKIAKLLAALLDEYKNGDSVHGYDFAWGNVTACNYIIRRLHLENLVEKYRRK